jgi:hypothetical protein
MGATITVTSSVTAGQGYYYKVLAAGGPGPIGGYGLLVNFGSQTQLPIPPPNTVVPSQPDQGGGTSNGPSGLGGSSGSGGTGSTGLTSLQDVFALATNLGGWVESLTSASVPSSGFSSNRPNTPGNATAFSVVQVGVIPTGAGVDINAQGVTLLNSTTLLQPPAQAVIVTGPALSILQATDEALDDLTS